MNLRQRFGITNPRISDEELERAHKQIQRLLSLEMRRARALGQLDAEQLEVEADVALWKAGQTYEGDKGATFPTHATNWARWSFGLAKRSMDPLGQSALLRRIRDLAAGKEIAPTLLPPASFDADPELQDFLFGLAEKDGGAAEDDRFDRIMALLPRLKPRQRERLLAYVMTGSQTKAAAALGVSKTLIGRDVHRAGAEIAAMLEREGWVVNASR